MGLSQKAAIPSRVELDLPLPPSINHYHGARALPVTTKKGKKTHRVSVYVKREGKQFIRDVGNVVIAAGRPRFETEDVAVLVDVHMPNNRGDHHNREKPILDALESAGVFDNDRQVVDLRVRRRHNVEGGRCHVTIWPAKR